MSALDGRIRSIAREEAWAVLADAPAVAGAQEAGGEVAGLRAQVEALAARVKALEDAPSLSDQVKASARRGAARRESTA